MKDEQWWRREASRDEALQHGLREEEYEGLLQALGRSLNMVELGICSALFQSTARTRVREFI